MNDVDLIKGPAILLFTSQASVIPIDAIIFL